MLKYRNYIPKQVSIIIYLSYNLNVFKSENIVMSEHYKKNSH